MGQLLSSPRTHQAPVGPLCMLLLVIFTTTLRGRCLTSVLVKGETEARRDFFFFFYLLAPNHS